MTSTVGCFVLCAVTASVHAAGPTVVINEVHYHPGDDRREGEFVELHNHGPDPVNMAGWLLEGGVQHLFGPGTVVPPGGYVLVAADKSELVRRYDLDDALVVGTYTGALSNGGELLRLWSAGGYIVSFVEYGDSDAWPESPDGSGPSLERVSPFLEETDAAAWEASIVVGGTPGRRNSVRLDEGPVSPGETVDLIPLGAEWRYLKGEDPGPPADWISPEFNDGAWASGPVGIGYGDGDDATVLDDMQGNYLTVFARREFQVEDPTAVESLVLWVDYDDGFVAYLNGLEIERDRVDSTDHDAPATSAHEAGTAADFPIPAPETLLEPGRNVLAIQGHNLSAASSDFSLAPHLEATLRDEDDPPPPLPLDRPTRDLVLSELSTATPLGWVELYNPTDEPVDAAGRRLIVYPPEGGDFALRPGTVVPPGECLLVSEEDLGYSLRDIHALILVTDDGRFIDALNPRTVDPTHSTGRFPSWDDNRCVFSEPTPGELNHFEPERRVVINEIMFHPGDSNPGGEFVELYNHSTEDVDLSGWTFTRGISYPIPDRTVLRGGEYLVIAGSPAALENQHGISGVLGPFTGRLDNDAETVQLRDALANVVDRVRYADEGSWPEIADGLGPSVELVHPLLENRYGPAWRASIGGGTPGRENSRFDPDPPPVVVAVEHAPVVPSPSDPVRVIATVSDATRVAGATLWWQLDGATGADAVEMLDDGDSDDGIPGNGVYGAELPPQADRSIVQFWIEGRGAGDRTVTVPEGAPRPAFLYQVENPEPGDVRPLYRLILRAADLQSLRTRGNGSNALLDTTVVADGRAYYNRGLRYRGSSARSCNPLSYRVQFDHDADFHGIKRLNLNGCNAYRQWLGLDYLRRTGIATPLAWFRRLSFNGVVERDVHLRVEAIDDQFLERNFPADADGNLYRGEGQANLDYRSEDADDYRRDYSKVTNEREDDYSDVVDLCFRFDAATTSDGDFPDAVDERVDTRQWAHFFAAFAILGSTENSILLNNGDDYFLYHRYSDGRWVLLPWDLDSCFDEEDQRLFRPTVDAIERFLAHPFYAPMYWCSLSGLLADAFGADVVNSRIDHLAPLYPAGVLNGLRAYAADRRAYIAARLQARLETRAVAGGTICGSVLFPSADAVALSGAAPACGTTAVLVDGIRADYDPVSAAWTATVEVGARRELEVLALRRDDEVIASARYALDAVRSGEPGDPQGPGPVHQQRAGADHVAMWAVDAQDITDPDQDGNTWGPWTAADSLRSDGRVLKCASDGRFREFGQSNAIYRIRFRSPGTYRCYFRARGYDSESDSIWRPSAFDADPEYNQRTSRDGRFSWTSGGDLEVTEAHADEGTVLELRIGMREFETELDAVVLHQDASLAGRDLEALLDEDAGIRPRSRIEVSPAAVVGLAGGEAHVTLDGSTSHDGLCGDEDLEYLWEKVEGPSGDVFGGDPTASIVDVVFSSEGSYRYALTVRSAQTPEASDRAEVSITVEPGAENLYMLCDANGDGYNDVSDVVFLLFYFYAAGPAPRCEASIDCNADGLDDMSDAVYNLGFLFLGHPLPPLPYPACDAAPASACAEATCSG